MNRPLTSSAAPSTTLADVTRSLNAWVEVDLDALDANVAAMRAAIGPAIELIAVVKANAYGAGVEGVAPALESAGVDRFAVVWLSEALALRRLGATLPIIVLGHSFPDDAEAAVRNDITLTCHSVALGKALSAAAVRSGRPARVHVKIDTGLHRFGVTLEEGVALAEALRRLPGVEVEGLTTHMANADENDDSFSEHQLAVFAEAVRRLPWIPFRHTANTATALRRPELRFNGVRIGLALHGAIPPNTPRPPLQPILSLRAHLARVVELSIGEGVAYGLTWRARRPSRVGLVPVGYADGWRRALGNRGRVLVGGRACPIVGRVMMDHFLVDITDVAGPAEGDEVVLIGCQGDQSISADDVAALIDTISWEIFASLQARLPRVYHRGGRVERVVGS